MKLTRNSPQDNFPAIQPTRRDFLAGVAATALTTVSTTTFALPSSSEQTNTTLKIEAVELVELHGRYTDEAGINRQQQVNPLDIYDDLRPAPYADKPSGQKRQHPRSTFASEPPAASTVSTAPSKKVRQS